MKRVTTSPHTDTHRRNMLFEVAVDGKLKRISRNTYRLMISNGLAVEIPWSEVTA